LLLAVGQEAIAKRDPVLLEMMIATADAALTQGPEREPFAGEVLSITRDAIAQGWEPYRLVLEGNDRLRVYVLNRANWPEQSVLVARRVQGAWELSGAIWSD
jgi:hypothetical protein